MPRPNAGGGRHNKTRSEQEANVPTRALFSNLAQYAPKGKGKDKGDKGKGKGKGKDKDRGKSSQVSPQVSLSSILQGDKPEPPWATIALTLDNRQVLYPLCKWELSEEEPPIPDVCWDFGEQKAYDASAYADPLAYLLGTSTDDAKVPLIFREKASVTKLRKQIEDRNLRFAHTAYEGVDTQNVIRLERMGFGKPRAMEALHERSLNDALRWLFADSEHDLEDTRTNDQRRDDLEDEIIAIQAIYGDELVEVNWSATGTGPSGDDDLMDLDVKVYLPSKWVLRMQVPAIIHYPMVPPLVSARHASIPPFNLPLLMELRKQCRGVIGSPMLMPLCNFLEYEADAYLRTAEEEVQLPAAMKIDSGGASRTGGAGAAFTATTTTTDAEREKAEVREAYAQVTDTKDRQVLDLRLARDNVLLDLAGYTTAQVRTLLTDVFETPRQAPLIRVTLILGGGKNVRQGYDPNLSKSIIQCMQEIGYAEDSSAAISWECCGFFKMQHDLKKNLKVAHVFPLTDKNREETELELFKRLMGSSMTPSWVTEVDDMPKDVKQRFNNFITDALESYHDIDTKLQEGKNATNEERKLYDETDVGELEQMLMKLSKRVMADRERTGDDDEGQGGQARGGQPSGGQPSGAFMMDEKKMKRGGQDKGVGAAVDPRKVADLFQKTPLRAIRENLPAHGYKEAIQEAVAHHQVVVIQGDTGCGKSTQVPQFILEAWAKQGPNAPNRPIILMSQPRRISAIGVSERIAEEMNVSVGSYVGYQIRLESKKSSNTLILVATTGVVLRRLEGENKLQDVTHIIVDEVHERDLDTDFLLIILREMIKQRPNLKVILMSATINAHVFTEYFAGSVTVSIPGRTFPVEHMFLEHALTHTNYRISDTSEYIKQLPEPLKKSDFEELVASYAANPLKDFEPTWEICEQMQKMDPEKINHDLVAGLVNYLHLSETDRKGSILIFVPGIADIRNCQRKLENINNLWVVSLHSTVAASEQRLVFQKPPANMRKVVVSTNIAETSITIDDVTMVIDCGRHKQTKYDPQNRISMLVDCVETKANAKQRKGRAGRVQEGICYTLLNWRKYRRIEEFEKPEMLRVPLNQICLRIQMLNMGHPFQVLRKAISPPTESSVKASLEHLIEINALEEYEASGLQITNLGQQLAQLPIETAMGKFLLYAVTFGVLDDALTIAASFGSKSPFTSKFDMHKGIDFLKLGNQYLESDFLMVLRVHTLWKEKKKNRYAWCRELGIDNSALEGIDELRHQLLGVLRERGFHPNPTPACIASITGLEKQRRKFMLLRGLIAAALLPNCVLRRGPHMHSKNQANCYFGPYSGLYTQEELSSTCATGEWRCKCTFFNFAGRTECKACGEAKSTQPQGVKPTIRHECFVYMEKSRSVAKGKSGSKIIIKGVSGLNFKSLAMFAAGFERDYNAARITIFGWIHLEMAARDIAVLENFRGKIQGTLDRVHSHSRLDNDGEIINACTQFMVMDFE